ncbi:MAG: hypothetical protein ISS70_00710 [Phycisphaerae bacterium]|nr:hypothetical protein [Phycisphaerae bacterium]
MSELNSARRDFVAKRKESLIKLDSFREDFRKKEKKVKADLEKAGRIWKGLDERFEWWWWRSQSLP